MKMHKLSLAIFAVLGLSSCSDNPPPLEGKWTINAPPNGVPGDITITIYKEGSVSVDSIERAAHKSLTWKLRSDETPESGFMSVIFFFFADRNMGFTCSYKIADNQLIFSGQQCDIFRGAAFLRSGDVDR
jgi:hypothetical protein